MTIEEKVKEQLESRFAELKGTVKVQRSRRIWVEVKPENFTAVFEYAIKDLDFPILCTITGMDEGANFALIYHLAQKTGAVLNLKIKFDKARAIKTISNYFPAAEIYEREVVDLFGIKIDGLKPGLRYPLPDNWPEGQYPLRKDWKIEALKDYDAKFENESLSIPIGPKTLIKEPTDFGFIPGSRQEEHEVVIPVGPQHPALKEPESFSVALRGERIMGVKVRIGYNHRGIEKACESQSYIQDVYLVERICGICSHTHSTCFVQGVEELAGLQVPKRGLYIRTLIAELERIHSHLLWLGVAGHEIGFDTLLMYTWRDRESVMDLLTLITGNRVNYGINTIGGVRRDLDATQIPEILKVVDKLEEQTKYYIQVAMEEVTVIQRLSGVGKLSPEDVVRLGTLGPTARASGLDRDTRRDDPYAAYGDLSFKVITDNHNDVYGRTIVRLGELMESYSMIRQLVKNLPDGPIAVKAPRRIPEGEVLSRYEAPRGEDVHYIKSNGSANPERVKVRAPTLANIQSVSKMLEDRYLADLPIVIAAIDPCFSCTDRAIQIQDYTQGTERVMSWEDLKKFSIDWYRERGVDFTRLSKVKWGKD